MLSVSAVGMCRETLFAGVVVFVLFVWVLFLFLFCFVFGHPVFAHSPAVQQFFFFDYLKSQTGLSPIRSEIALNDRRK